MLSSEAESLLHPGKPEGFDEDNSNPFGYAKGVPFRLYEDAELFVLDSDMQDAKQADIYEQYKKCDGASIQSGGDWSHKNSVGISDDIYHYWFLDAVPLDLGYNDSPRKTCIGFVGVIRTGNNFNVLVRVYDTKSGTTSDVCCIGSMKNIESTRTTSNPETMLYQMRNFLTVTAGDYDGDGVDSMVVYGAFENGPHLIEVKVSGDGINKPVLETGAESSKLLHDIYINKLYGLNPFQNDTNVDGRMKLGCSLATGDINGDLVDDLAVLSYTQKLEDTLVTPYGKETVMPALSVVKGGSGKSGNALIGSEPDMKCYVGTEKNDPSQTGTEYLSLSTPTVDIINTTLTKNKGLLIGGYEETVSVTASEIKTERSRQKATAFIYGEDKGALKPYMSDTKSICAALAPQSGSEFETYAGSEYTYPKLPTVSVSIDGSGNPDRVFLGGVIYEVAGTSLTEKLRIPCLDNEDYSSDHIEVYLDDTAVQSLTKLGGNYESLVFSLVRVKVDTNVAAFSPYKYFYKTGAAGPEVEEETGKVTGNYYATANSQNIVNNASMDILQDVSLDFINGNAYAVNHVLCPVDSEDDGMVVRYREKDYVYADPKILAVLQASPYFAEIGQKPGGTEYSFTDEFCYGDEKSNTKSYGVGIEGHFEGGPVEASLRIGYSGETRRWSETNLSTEVTLSFEADNDSVVVYRTPIVYYTYDVYNPGNGWEEGAFSITYVKPGKYEQLSVADYNAFAEEYNRQLADKVTAAGKDIKDFTTLSKLGDGIFLGLGGQPEKYYRQEGQALDGFATIDTNVHGLGYNGGVDATELVTGTEVTTGAEQSHGVSVEFEFLLGPQVARVGLYGSFEQLWGHAVTSANTQKTGVKTSVANIVEDELISKGYTPAQVRAYKFDWLPARWSSGITYTSKSKDGKQVLTQKVPVYGYTLSEVSKPYNLSEAVITLDKTSFDYKAGVSQIPAETVKIGDRTLVRDRDYAVSYSNAKGSCKQCIDPGTYYVNVTGIGTTVGSGKASFTITGSKTIDISGANVALSDTSFTYNGNVQKPVIRTIGGRTLQEGTDYTVRWSSSSPKKVGTYTLTVTGKGQYSGQTSASYKITAQSIAKAKIVLSKTSFTYNGNVQKPVIKTIGGKTLKDGTDYTVKWSSASPKKVGTYTLTVTGKGNYNGQTKASYKINKASNPLKVTAKKPSVKAAKLKKSAYSLARKDVVNVSKAQGSLTYAKGSGSSSKLTVNQKTGKVTLAKGTKKGTYTLKYKVTAAGNTNYKKGNVTVTVKVTVK